jgi:hypothetical protein
MTGALAPVLAPRLDPAGLAAAEARPATDWNLA